MLGIEKIFPVPNLHHDHSFTLECIIIILLARVTFMKVWTYIKREANAGLLLLTDLTKFFRHVYNCTGRLSIVSLRYPYRRVHLVRDLGMIGQILDPKSANAFQAFVIPDVDLDPLLAKCPPFAMNANSWIHPVFNERVLKHSFKHLSKIRTNMHTTFWNLLLEYNYINIDLKRLVNEFSKNIMMNIGLGMNYSINETDTCVDFENALHICNTIQSIFKPTITNGPRQILNLFGPRWLARITRSTLISKDFETKFRWLIMKMLKRRRSHTLIDWIAESMESDINKNLLIQQVFAFLVETHLFLNVVGSFALFRLAQNPKVQDKARLEVNEMLQQTNGTWSHSTLERMIYLDQIIMETMRMNPPVGCIARICTEPFTIFNDHRAFNLQKDDLLFISNEGINMDQKYWTNPEIFDPDRFSPTSMNSLTNPIIPLDQSNAERFYFMALKTLLAMMLTTGKIIQDPETPENVLINRWSYVPRVTSRFCIDLKRLR